MINPQAPHAAFLPAGHISVYRQTGPIGSNKIEEGEIVSPATRTKKAIGISWAGLIVQQAYGNIANGMRRGRKRDGRTKDSRRYLAGEADC